MNDARVTGPAPGDSTDRPAEPAAPGFYVHVPFCRSKCAYCDFASRAGAGPATIRRWLDGLRRELEFQPPGFAPATVYLGGGTPTALDAATLNDLLALLRDGADLRHVTEWTSEANPGTLDAAKCEVLRAGGVNRLSIGAQSFDAHNLRGLGRTHTAADIGAAARAARAAGFDDVGLDLMYALPFAPLETLRRDLEQALELAPEHISAYALTIEPGTPLAARVDAGEVREVEDESAFAQYETLRHVLTTAGFAHYEISNFARAGRACRHNLLYWSGGEYLGIGPSAHSHLGGVRRGNRPELTDWAEALEQGRSPVTFEERLTPEAAARETLVFSLRRLAGVDRAAFRRRTGFDMETLRGTEIARLVADGLLEWDGPRLRLAPKAYFISDTVFAALI